MIRKILVVVLSVILTIIEITLLSEIKIFNVFLRFSLPAVILVSWLGDRKLSLINGGVIGLMLDVAGSKIPCLYFVLYLLVSYGVNFLSDKADVRRAYICLACSFVITLTVETAYYMIEFFNYKNSLTAFSLSRIIIPQAFFNMLVCFCMFFVYRIIFVKINQRRAK